VRSRVRFVAALLAILLAAVCLLQGAGSNNIVTPAEVERVAGPLAR